ncbi:MAG: MATE family efflux transporter [Geminicoccaceae bacterium]|nr:MATE family efflux transporter [Geminicoccaceae bacterium]
MSRRERAEDGLTSGPIPVLVRRIAVPSATAMAAQTVFNVTNSYWAGTWSTEALAALATAFPIFFTIIAATFGFSQGTAALLAHALGAGRPQEARRLWAHALGLALLAGLVLGGAGVLVAPALAGVLGARGTVLDLAVLYLVPIFAMAPLFLLAAVTNAALTANGDSRSLRDAVLAATLLNAGLVPVLMYGLGGVPGLGIAGIAASHLLVQTGQLAWLALRASRTPIATGLGRALREPDRRLAGRILAQVVPNTLTLMTTGIGLAIVTGFVGRYGAAAVAGYGVALRIEQLVLLPALGLNAATVALVGQNLGAGRIDRVRAAAAATLGTGVVLMALGGVLVFFLRRPLLALFSDDPAVLSLGALYLGFAVLAFPAYAIVVLGAGVLQGLRRPVPALLVGTGRHLLAPPLVLWSLDVGLGLGFVGIALAVPAVTWAGALASGLLVLRFLPRPSDQAAAR